MKKILSVAAFGLMLSGCWTFDETPYPSVQISGAAATPKTVNLAGFEALLTEWEAAHGYRTVYVPGHCGYRHYAPGYVETVSTLTYIPQRRSTDMFLRRAQDLFEKAGFLLSPTAAELTVDVRFEGPFVEADGDMKKFGWNVLSVFFCDYGATRWTAKLRIRETKTGRLLFHHDYDQPYVTHVFGLIPLFGISSCDATDPVRMQSWCLAALTDRACADATAFVAGQVKK